MNSTNFGKTGKQIFRIGIGTYGHGDAYGPITKKQSLDVFKGTVSSFPDNAFILIDTAPRYGEGQCEKVIGKLLKQFPDKKILIATKGGRHIEPMRLNEKDFSPDFLKQDLEGSLKRLGVSQVFLYQLHNPSLEVLEKGEVFDVLEEFRAQGKIDFYGVSIDGPQEGVTAIKSCLKKGYTGLIAIQTIYNILDRRINKKFIETAAEAKTAIIAREPMLRGLLTDQYQDYLSNPTPAVKKLIKLYGKNQLLEKIRKVRYIIKGSGIEASFVQVAIKFVISQPGISLAIPGINRVEFIRPDLSAEDVVLNSLLIQKLKKVETLHEIE